MRDILQSLRTNPPWGKDKKFLGLPLIDVAILALPIAACAVLLVSFVARYGEFFPDTRSGGQAPLFLSASLPSLGGNAGANIGPYVGAPFLRPSFGLGAFSAETDRLPDGSLITPVPFVDGPDHLTMASLPQAPFSETIQGPAPEDSRVATAANSAVGPLEFVVSTMAVAPGLDSPDFVTFRPTARPGVDAASLASLTTTIEDGGTEGTEGTEGGATISPQDLLETYAVALSPRPEYRPARLLSAERALEAVNAAALIAPSAIPTPSPTPTLAPTLARLSTEPGGLVIRGPSGQTCSRRLARAIPRRPGRAQTGSAFVGALSASSGGSRDAAIAREAMSGNVPKFMRNLVPVSFTGRLGNGRETTITICVTPDYLAIGSDADYVRVPMGLRAAGQIADHFNMMLPTTRMVDAIYTQAAVRLSPQPMQAGSQMSSTPYFLRHNATVEGQRRAAGGRLGVLVSGHKKDLVLTNRLASAPGRVAIYGWHRTNGRPIQPLSTVHGASYADYSHGIRLVSQTAYVDGRAANLQDLLQNRQYAAMLNSGGVIGRPAIRLAGL